MSKISPVPRHAIGPATPPPQRNDAPNDAGAAPLPYPKADWYNWSPDTDGIEGARLNQAYAAAPSPATPKPVIVAVIDGGLDVEHEDLRDHIWTNPGEIPGNGIDDDGNGYADDVHGWNFLGSVGKDGRPINLEASNLSVTREVARLQHVAEQRPLTDAERADLHDAETQVETARTKARDAIAELGRGRGELLELYSKIETSLSVPFEELSFRELRKVESDDPNVKATAKAALKVMSALGVLSVPQIDETVAANRDLLDVAYNVTFGGRTAAIGDDPYDYADRSYGNGDVAAPRRHHGTPVAGIIGAVRGNGRGIDGAADSVRIMPIRAIPLGDEYDKDVANAIRYAVDNGANIINLSFCKPYSPGKAAVDAAVDYAASKGVLIIHASGNEHLNTDATPTFPNRNRGADGTGRAPNWIEVGASGPRADEFLAAPFSNYGKESVDLFAPGMKILSTVPEHDQYQASSGTSLAAPVVSGVAAFLLSRHPDMDPEELRDVLMKTARRHPGLMVRVPGTGTNPVETVEFDSLSRSGGIVDAYLALKEAGKRQQEESEPAA